MLGEGEDLRVEFKIVPASWLDGRFRDDPSVPKLGLRKWLEMYWVQRENG